MSNLNMFSRLSRGYGTWDGIAKRDAAPEVDREFISLSDLYLPPIAPTYKRPPNHASQYEQTSILENKPFKLPDVNPNAELLSERSMPKTYTTRKGALLLYAEDYFLPGSPKPKKRRRKPKKTSGTTLNTLTDLRDFILDYKRNGGDPLFLALLQKRLSGYHDKRVRPGFSPKRYIATLGRTLQEHSWNKLAESGSFKDPALQTYNPFLSPFHPDGSHCDLFPDKPQPYSTMSLPPISPSSSMLGSSWQFYNNGMSTGAASVVSINSEEYAPSSRAMSPVESLHDRLTEVETVQPKKDYRYALLDSKQKEELLSHMLVQRALETVDSDFQSWPSNFNAEDSFALEQDPAPSFRINTIIRKRSKGSLTSASLSSIPRLPPIQSAGARTLSAEGRGSEREKSAKSSLPRHDTTTTRARGSSAASSEAKRGAQGSAQGSLVNEGYSRDIFSDTVDPDGIQLDLSEDGSQWGDALAQVMPDVQSEGGSVEDDNVVAALLEGPASLVDNKSETEKPSEIVDRESDDSVDVSEHGGQREETAADTMRQSRASDGHKSPMSAHDSGTGDLPMALQHKESVTSSGDVTGSVTGNANDVTGVTGSTADVTEGIKDSTDDVTSGATGSTDDVTGGATGSTGEVAGDVKDCIDDVTDDVKGSADDQPDDHTSTEDMTRGGAEEIQKDADNVAAGFHDSASTSSLSIHEDHGPSPEPPPPITFEKLQDEARVVASRILKRPQSGAVFMEDARAALLMWADRLSSLLGPPTKDARTSSAAQRRTILPMQNATGVHGSLAAPVRKRKVSRSAAPSLAALRQALLISGGEVPDIEALRANLPSIPTRRASKPGSKLNSGVTHGHTYYEPLKDGETKSTRDSGSAGPTRSILTERLSNSDLQMEILNYVTNDEQEFEDDWAQVLEDTESEDEAQFRAALQAVVTDIKHNVATEGKVEPRRKSKPKSSAKPAEKTKTPPFQVTRPIEEKAPPGLKPLPPAAKKAKPVKKTVKKEAKKGTKGTGKAAAKTKKGKAEEKHKDADESSEIQAVLEKESDVEKVEVSEEVSEEFTEPTIRVDSEASEQQHTVFVTSSESDSFVTPSVYSEVTTSKGTSSPTASVTTSVAEQPRLVPRISEPRPDVDAEDEEHAQRERARKEAEIAKQKEKEARTAKKAEERAAAAEKRRLEVERKRREREEAKRKQIEEAERLERVRQEAEEEMQRREEERRRRREETERERKRKEEEEQNCERQAQAKQERDKRMREEFERKKQELIAQRKLEEEIRKEQEKMERELEEASRREEEERIKNMEESERLALQEKMRREEEELRRRLEEQRLKEEEERRILEEQRRLREEALALIRQKKIKRHLFVAGILREMQYLGLEQRLTRAFTFSYFDMLPWNYLQTRPSSPMKEALEELKKTLPPTIMEEDEDEDLI